MGLINDIKIEIQQWIYRKRRKALKTNDDKAMMKAIQKANEFTAKTGNRLWVIKIQPCDYRIFTKSQVKGFFRTARPILSDVNYYKTNEYIIHITNRSL